MKIQIFIISLITLVSCNTKKYSGYVYDGDIGQPLDSVLVTDNFEAAEAWLNGEMPTAGEYLHILTDNNGFFSFKGTDENDHVILFIRKGYQREARSQGTLISDTLYLRPNSELRKAREEERWKCTTTIRQFPMHAGDTVFIANEESTTVYINDTTIPPIIQHTKVYIDPDKNSEHYNRVINFNLDDPEWYHRVPATSKRTIPSSLPRRWVPLTEYKGNYYLYSSLECGIMRYEISDTTLISLGWMDGDYGFAYKNIVQEATDQYAIKGIYREGFPIFDEIRIYIIDADKGIAVFEMYENSEIMGQQLLVDATKARNFPIIVHEYYGNIILKPTYYPLDTTDLDKLLKKFRPLLN